MTGWISRMAAVAMGLTVSACGYAFDNQTCADFMAGRWVGEGTVRLGRSVEMKSDWTLGADGKFIVKTSYQREDGAWEASESTGTWTAGPGEEAGQCKIEQTSGAMTAATRITVTGADTIESFGLELRRQGG